MLKSRDARIAFRRFASNDSFKYCLDSVRQYDHENFTATLLLPEKVLAPAIVVRAFNVEVSRIRDQVSDDKIAPMRFQFWSDALDKVYSKDSEVPSHPVVQQLKKVCQRHQISKRYLNRLLVCRKQNFSKKFYSTLEEMEKYAEESVSPIYYAILETFKIQNVHADHAASHLGKAQGLTNMLRSIKAAAQNRTVLLPQDVLIKHNLSQESVLRCRLDQNYKDAIFDVATRANQHLQKARSITVPSDCKSIFLPAVGVDSYLKRLQKKDFALFDSKLTNRNSILPLLLYWNKLLSKY